MTDAAGGFALHIEQIDDFEFRVRFDKEQYPELRMDKPAPLGLDRAPNPARVLAAAPGAPAQIGDRTPSAWTYEAG